MFKRIRITNTYAPPTVAGVLLYPLLKAGIPDTGSYKNKVVFPALLGSKFSSSLGKIVVGLTLVVCSSAKFPNSAPFWHKENALFQFSDTIPPVCLRSIAAREPIVLQIRTRSSNKRSD